MSRLDVDVSELNKLEADLGRIPPKVMPAARKVVRKGALNVKNDARKAISGLDHAPLYPQSIGFDTRVGGGVIEATIGPDKAKPQGALGNILEYGTSKNVPFAHLGPAMDREGPRFEQAAAELVRGLVDL